MFDVFNLRALFLSFLAFLDIILRAWAVRLLSHGLAYHYFAIVIEYCIAPELWSLWMLFEQDGYWNSLIQYHCRIIVVRYSFSHFSIGVAFGSRSDSQYQAQFPTFILCCARLRKV